MNDRPLLGILLMLGFCLLAPLADGLAKLLSGAVPVAQLVAVRFAAQALLLAPLVLARRRPLPLDRALLSWSALRTLLHIAGIATMFAALRYLPVADAIAIAFVMPFLMLLLGKLFLGEEVGPHRLAACAVGFAGTLLVIRPNFAAVGAPALLPLLMALIFALFMLVTRQISRRIEPVALQFLNGVMASVVLLPLLALATGRGWPGLSPVLPGADTLALLAALGAVGTLAHLLMTWSLRFAPSATLAPMQYLEIPFATLVGWLLFRDLPDGLAALGIGVTLAAGLYIVARERQLSRAAGPRLSAPAPAPARRPAG